MITNSQLVFPTLAVISFFKFSCKFGKITCYKCQEVSMNGSFGQIVFLCNEILSILSGFSATFHRMSERKASFLLIGHSEIFRPRCTNLKYSHEPGRDRFCRIFTLILVSAKKVTKFCLFTILN